MCKDVVNTTSLIALADVNSAKITAKHLELTVTGTLGVLIRSKKEGYIEKVKPVLDSLIADGFFISEEIFEYVITEAGER